MENKGLIYIAEDKSGVREVLSEFFKIKFPDYELEVFEEGASLKKGLEKLILNPRNTKLVITDNDVPYKDEGLKIIEEYSSKFNFPFILFSGYDKRQEALEVGAYGFLMKPFDLMKFADLIQKALDSPMKKINQSSQFSRYSLSI